MAQRKRVVRSYQPRQRQVFDDHQWPIDMALVVFGGFMVGSILVYQRFDDPRWYVSPWLSIAGVVLLIAATIWTLRSVGNRFVRVSDGGPYRRHLHRTRGSLLARIEAHCAAPS